MGKSVRELRLCRPMSGGLHNFCQHAIQILADLGIGESQHSISRTTKHIIAICVLCAIMGIAIDLDHKAQIATDEVADKAQQNDLARKFQTIEAGIAELLPELVLERCRLVSHRAGEGG